MCEPVDNKFGLPAALQTDPADKRVAFFFNATGGAGTVNRGRASFFTANNSALPIYRTGEIMLIKAEALVRKATPDLTDTGSTQLRKPGGSSEKSSRPEHSAKREGSRSRQHYRAHCIGVADCAETARLGDKIRRPAMRGFSFAPFTVLFIFLMAGCVATPRRPPGGKAGKAGAGSPQGAHT